MDEECEVEQIFAQVPSIDLDPGQVNLLLSSLKPVDQTDEDRVKCIEVDDFPHISDCSSEVAGDGYKVATVNPSEEPQGSNLVLNVSPLFRPTPPPLTSNFKLHHCRLCDFFSLSSEACAKHEALDHPSPRPTIQCISCPNIFLSLQALKVHLLLDHEVLKSELQSILLLTLRKCEEFLLSSSSSGGIQKMHSNQDWDNVSDRNTGSTSLTPPCFADKNIDNLSTIPEHSEAFPVSSLEPFKPVSLPGTALCSRTVFKSLKTMRESEIPSHNRSMPLPSYSLPPVSELCQAENSGEVEGFHQQNCAPHSPKQISIASSHDSKSGGSCDDSLDEEDEDDELYTDDSDDGNRPTVLEDAAESINKHINLMEQLKKDKSKANRCRISVKCHLRFKSLNTLDYHKKCHDLSKNCWKCPECSRTFTAWNSLSLHLWNDHSIDMELYYCNFCSFRTPNLSHLKTTHIWIHGKAKMFTCPVCSKAVKTKKQLRNHQATHKKNHIRYECKQCKALFSQCHLLRQHYDTVHLKTRRFRCSTCGHRSASRSAHDLHLRKHTKEKKYACGECCYSTGDHNALRRHLATHSGVRPYSCPHCTYTTIHSTSLRAHVNSKHPGMLGDVVFSCPLCPFKTLRKDLFVAHASKHNFDSPLVLKDIQLGLNGTESSSPSK